MSSVVGTHELGERLRALAGRFERALSSVSTESTGWPTFASMARKNEMIREWGTHVGRILDEAFEGGLLQWEHYDKLKADECRRHREAADWHYRLFLATTGDVAASDAATGRVLIPGFLSAEDDGWHDLHAFDRGCACAYGQAIREIANLLERGN